MYIYTYRMICDMTYTTCKQLDSVQSFGKAPFTPEILRAIRDAGFRWNIYVTCNMARTSSMQYEPLEIELCPNPALIHGYQTHF